MIKEWENHFQQYKSQRCGYPKAQEGTPAEGEQNSRKPSRICSDSHPCVVQDFPHHKEDLCTPSPLGIWTAFYKSDPRIALGKYSPMEQEIQHLGGVHTRAARRFLVEKQYKEWRMLRELQKQSADYKRAVELGRDPSSYAVCGPPEKIWTAKVSVPAEEFQTPHREVTGIKKHIKRMQLARALENKQSSTDIGRLSPKTDKFSEEGEDDDTESNDKANRGEKGEAKFEPTNKREVTLNVAFKSEETKSCVVCHRNDRKTFLPVKRPERRITGLTNRNLFPITGFPGDLMLMNQDFVSKGIHPSDAIKIYWLPEEDLFKGRKQRPACCPH
uniref:RIKEN cDNA 4933402N03 gene n=1 Tax=Mus spicilegus TaxID=10103 RepID=A0A8C6HV16_MUSSI